jgi:hypothetical protein
MNGVAESVYEDLLFESNDAIIGMVSQALRMRYGGRLRWNRQVATSAGTADIVIAHEHGFTVVELKAVAIDAQAVAQVLRYMGAIRLQVDAVSEIGLSIHGIVAAPSLTRDGAFALVAAGEMVQYTQLSLGLIATPVYHVEDLIDDEKFLTDPGETLERLRDHVIASRAERTAELQTHE